MNLTLHRPLRFAAATFAFAGAVVFAQPAIAGIIKASIPRASAAVTNADPAPPAAPTGVSASGKNLAADLAWSPTAGAISYAVRRAPWNGGPQTLLISGLTSTAFTDSGLLNGTRYFYTVSATGPGGESALSIEVSAVPQAAATPQSLPFLHPLFAANAVLQRDALVPIWGWTTPGAQVSVTIHGQTITTSAAATGRWEATVGPFAADGVAYSLSVSGPQSVTVSNLVFGDVFIFSGQSNMERQLGPRSGQQNLYNYQAEAAAANYPNIRSFYVPEVVSGLPQSSLNASWSVCNPTNVLNITAVGYFTTRALHLAETVPGPGNTVINVPMGILFTAWGGTRVDAWLETNEAAAVPELTGALNNSPVSFSNGTPSAIYNQMIAPLAPFRIRGVVWYQGENSADRAAQYHRLLPALMNGWRRIFGQPNLPFVVVQLVNWGGATTWPDLREAQLATIQADPYSRLTTGTDIGETNDIHPRDKLDVGIRAARAMRDLIYGETLVSQGPLFTGATIEGTSIRCAFSNASSGLMAGAKVIVQNPDSSYTINPVAELPGGVLTGFTIAGADKNFVAATATIDSATNTVVVSAASVTAPLYVRYAFTNDPTCNLYNKITDAGGNVLDGLPASPFRNDPVFRLNVLYGSGTNNYTPGTSVNITAITVANLSFRFWTGDTTALVNPANATTSATVTRRYQTVGANYQLTSAPLGLSATPGSEQVTLSWTALNNAVAYSVKRATSSGGPFTTLATGLLTPSYTDFTAGSNTTNYYVVSASNAVAESPNSAAISATSHAPGAWSGNGADNNWLTAGNWSVTPFAGDVLHFAGATRLASSNNFAAFSFFNGITFDAGAGAFVLSGNTFNLGGNIINNSTSLQTISLGMVLTTPSTIINAATGPLTIGSIISDGGQGYGLIKTGPETLTLSGQSTFTGNILVSAGTLVAATGGATNATAGNLGNAQTIGRTVTVSSGATLNFFNTTTNDVWGNQNGNSALLPTIILNGGTLTSTRYNRIGALQLSSGATLTNNTAAESGNYQGWELQGTVSVGGTSGSTITAAASSPTKYGYHLNTPTSFQVAATGGTGADLSILAALRNRSGNYGNAPASLTKSGAGTMLLASGDNTYTGGTTISGGTLLLGNSTGNALGTGAVTVQNGGTLGGTGISTAPVSVQSSGALAPGLTGAAGTLRLAALTPTDGSIIKTDLATPTTSDVVAVSGSYTASGTTRIDLTALAGFAGTGTYPLITGATGISAASFTLGSKPAGYYFTLSVSGSTLNLIATAYTAQENWRQQYFGTPANNGSAADDADPDGDGSSNAQEYAAGTNPTDPASAFKITQLQPGQSGWTISFPTAVSKTYRLESSSDLQSNSWAVVQDNIAGTGAVVQITDSAGNSAPQLFYRARIVP